MSETMTEFASFEELRPQVLALLALHHTAETEEARAAIMSLFERAFLATAWNVAEDLLENGWTPQRVAPRPAPTPMRRGGGRLKVVGGTDAA